MMFRVLANYHNKDTPNDVKSKSCILKTLPNNEMALEKLGKEHYNVQNKEMDFYQRLIPEFESILRKIGEDGKTFPTVMAVYKEIDLIVLEDLKEKNFVMAERLKGLDIVHMKLALAGLAKIHAASMVLYEKDKNAFKDFEMGFYNRQTRAFDVMFTSNLEVLTDEVATWVDWSESKYFAAKLKEFQKTLMENGCKAFDFNEDELNAFNHGDLWTNNILYTYEKSAPSEAIILDFQYSFFGSAVLDLQYFLFTSLPDALRFEKMEELIQFYYYQLKDLMERLSYDMRKFPSLHGFQIEFFKKIFYGKSSKILTFLILNKFSLKIGFSACLLTVPIMINQESDANFEALMSVDERGMDFKRRIYKNPRVKSIAMQFLPIFDRKGVFDEF